MPYGIRQLNYCSAQVSSSEGLVTSERGYRHMSYVYAVHEARLNSIFMFPDHVVLCHLFGAPSRFHVRRDDEVDEEGKGNKDDQQTEGVEHHEQKKDEWDYSSIIIQGGKNKELQSIRLNDAPRDALGHRKSHVLYGQADRRHW